MKGSPGWSWPYWEFADIDIVFDATNAGACEKQCHFVEAKRILYCSEALTPAAIGPACSR